MTLKRRALLATALPALGAIPARAGDAPAELAAYERSSGGRIGVHAENLRTGRKIEWRSRERFVMCSTFKLSLAAWVLKRVDAGLARNRRRGRTSNLLLHDASHLDGTDPRSRENTLRVTESLLARTSLRFEAIRP